MIKKGFTFVVIPPNTSSVLRLKLSNRGLVGALSVLFLFAVLGLYSMVRLVWVDSRLSEYDQLRSEYLRQQVSIKKVANRMDQFKGQMDQLRELDYKLRLITDLEVERPRPSIYGIGGFQENTDTTLVKEADQNNLDLIGLLNKDLARLEKVARYQEESFNNLKTHLADRKDLVERTPYRWPAKGFLSSVFGPRTDPFTGQQTMHSAIDIVAPKGTPILAPADGLVTFTGVDPSLGNMLVVDHGYGVITRYGHTDTHMVREGQRVKRGDTLGTVGSSGRSTGPHLHYEVLINDVPVNPLKMIIN
ncbi:MAG: M23 family metallopeptidase [Deltaproteobacteria bacterium]|nr:M23 family metallopeptidase [Deltaproteobacteria bacterium]